MGKKWNNAAKMALAAVVLAGGYWQYRDIRLNASLPILDDEMRVAGLSHQVTIGRDNKGVAVITATNRQDAAIATGYLHGQERFFQMDLSRRLASGRLSEVFGNRFIEQDRSARIHRFAERAEHYYNQLPNAQKLILQAYAEGVNQGLADLGDNPFEYVLVGESPQAWQAHDALLVLYSMYITLQGDQVIREAQLVQMKNTLPKAMFEFLTPNGSHWEVPIEGELPSIHQLPEFSELTSTAIEQQPTEASFAAPAIGSNSWAVSSRLSRHGGAILANDMHLPLAVPSTWYRVKLDFAEQGENYHVIGVTIPGMPQVVVGSNGRIAWGFTNSYGDWLDLYAGKTGASEEIKYQEQTIVSRDKGNRTLGLVDNAIGPLLPRKPLSDDEVVSPLPLDDNALFIKWVAHDVQAVNFTMLELEQAKLLPQALNVAQRSGLPAQNFVAVDAKGNIGWTIAGPIPKRQTCEKGYLEPLTGKTMCWSGYLEPAEYPQVINPSGQRIWTANARVVSGEKLEKLGNGGYDLAARAHRIKQLLNNAEQFDEKDMLDIQLDTHDQVIYRWKPLFLWAAKQLAEQNDLVDTTQQMVELVEQWQGGADADSVAYRFVISFRRRIANRVFAEVTNRLKQQNPNFNIDAIAQQWEVPLWQMVSRQPEYLLPKAYDSWHKLIVGGLEETVELFDSYGQDLASLTWGSRIPVELVHPLSSFMPFYRQTLNMPAFETGGSSFSVKVQDGNFGASMRMVVSPGKESEAIFHMPAGQSGHPFSPYYRSEQEDWANGVAAPLLPTAIVHQLILQPQH